MQNLWMFLLTSFDSGTSSMALRGTDKKKRRLPSPAESVIYIDRFW